MPERKFQRRQYEQIAKLFGELKMDERTIRSFCEFFRYDNPNFKEDVFRKRIVHYWGKPFTF
tara:strand:+ start:1034 stop:1219 length:186 start_codon:yes stop_codon:yes gene_type:complete